jgi:hypothetical protein
MLKCPSAKRTTKRTAHRIRLPEEEVDEMGKMFSGFRVGLILGATTVTLLYLPYPVHSQSASAQTGTTQNGAMQDRQAGQQDRLSKPMTSRGGTWRDSINFSIAIAKLPASFAKHHR